MQFLPHFCGVASSSSLLSHISLLDTVNRMCIRFIHQWICLELSGGSLQGSQLYKDEASLRQKLIPPTEAFSEHSNTAMRAAHSAASAPVTTMMANSKYHYFLSLFVTETIVKPLQHMQLV